MILSSASLLAVAAKCTSEGCSFWGEMTVLFKVLFRFQGWLVCYVGQGSEVQLKLLHVHVAIKEEKPQQRYSSYAP